LPRPQKTAASRALYGEDHVSLLSRIAELKQAGRSLREIRSALENEVAHANESGEDLAARENERVRRAILRAATQEFAAKGYRETRVSTIIKKAGVTPQVFYGQFPGKSALLVESFKTFLSWNLAFVEPELQATDDLGERLLWRMRADFKANAFGSDVLSSVNSAGAKDSAAQARLVEEAWEAVMGYITADLASVRPPDLPPPLISLDLLAYSLVGASHNASLRASWDERFDKSDIIRVHLWLYLAVLAGLSGEVDIDGRVTGYEDLIQEIAHREPEMPPAPEEQGRP
jgi:AcrR family transcriptional regulator